jgi:hypothetical protein
MTDSSQFRGHLRRNVVSYVALFFALTMGTAYATHPGGVNTISTDDIQSQAVTNQKIAPQAVQAGRLADGAVTSAKLADEAVTNSKIMPQAVQTGRLANAAVTNAKLAPDSVDSAQVADDTITGDDVDESTLDLSSLVAAGENTLDHSCFTAPNPSAICASTTVNLPKASRVLVSATGNWSVLSFPTSGQAWGHCNVAVDGADQGDTLIRVGERQTAAGASPWSRPTTPTDGSFIVWSSGSMALTDIAGPLAAGNHTFGIRCTNVEGSVRWGNMKVTAGALRG